MKVKDRHRFADIIRFPDVVRISSSTPQSKIDALIDWCGFLHSEDFLNNWETQSFIDDDVTVQ